MQKPSKIMIYAVATAAAVLGLSLWVGSGSPGSPDKPVPPPVNGSNVPPGVTGADPRAGALPSLGAAKNYIFETHTSRGNLVEMSGTTFDPLPQGRGNVGKPDARVHLSDHDLLRITAERGTIYAPENQPRSGQLSGHIEVSLYKSPPHRRVDLSPDSPDLQLRLFLDEARFDFELGQVDSDGPVVVTHPMFDFRGRGLTMTYNQLTKKIDHLEIFEGQSLRIKAGVGPQNGLAGGSNKTPARKSDASMAAAVFYRAQLFNTVSLSSPDVGMTGDELAVIFSLQNRAPGQPGAEGDAVPFRAGSPASSPANDPALKGTASATQPSGDGVRRVIGPQETLAPPDPSDVVITWKGKLILKPVEPPAELAGPDDAMLAIAGRPLRIVTAKKESVVAAVADYQLSNGQVRIKGSQQTPLVIQSTELGQLRGQQLVINQSTGKGTILGGGVLRGVETQRDPAAGGTTELTATGLPPGMTVAWKDRLDLGFAIPSDIAAGRRPVAGFNHLKLTSATFRGDTQVLHPDLTLASDALGVVLDPEGRKGQPSLRAIVADGRVKFDTVAKPDQPASSTMAEHLEVVMGLDSQGRPSPVRTIARGKVDTKFDKMRMQAGEAVLDLVESKDNSAPAQKNATPFAAGAVRLAGMTARGDVHIELAQENARLLASAIKLDVAGQKLDAFGDAVRPAQLSQDQGFVTGQHLVLNRESKTLDVPGAGVFMFLEQAGEKQGEALNRMTCSWAKSMTFDQSAGLVHCVGDVRVEGAGGRGREVTRLTAQDVLLSFEPQAGKSANASTNLTGGSDAAHRVRYVTAAGGVVFSAEKWEPRVGQKLINRLTIQGPNLAFDNGKQLALVNGAGRMLVEDYTPAVGGAQNPSDVAKESGIKFANGRGQTLFTWKDSLAFDVLHNGMDMRGAVQMVHRPDQTQDVVTMDCARLTAELDAQAGGVESWMSGKVKSPKLKTVTATRDVNIVAGKWTIRTDQASFDSPKNAVVLEAGAGRETVITDKNNPQPFSAQAIQWNLGKDSFEIVNPGAGRIQVR